MAYRRPNSRQGPLSLSVQKNPGSSQGSSGPKYVVDHVTAGLQFFLRDLPWLSPDDLNEEAFALFFDSLFTLLKNQAAEP